MCTLSPRQFTARLAQAGVSQAAFARLTGLSARQVNNWCRGRAIVPSWAAALAVLLEHHSPDSVAMMVEEAALAEAQTHASDYGFFAKSQTKPQT